MDVSFIIPALDEEKYIEKTLKSIKAQKTKLSYEIIVVDGKSKDNTVKIAKKYSKVLSQKTMGIANARNLGAKKAKGKLLVFIDADTTLDSNYIDIIWNYLNKHKDVVGVTARLDYGFKNLAFKFLWWFAERYIRFRSWGGKGRLTGINTAVWGSTFKDVKGFPEVPSEDVAFTGALWKFGKTKYLMKTVAHTSPRRFDKDPWGIIQYYFVRDVITFTQTHKSKRFRKIEEKVEKTIKKRAEYKEIR